MRLSRSFRCRSALALSASLLQLALHQWFAPPCVAQVEDDGEAGDYEGSPDKFPRRTDVKVHHWVSEIIKEAKEGLDSVDGGFRTAPSATKRAISGSGIRAAEEARRVAEKLPQELSETVDGQRAFRKADYQDGNDTWDIDYKRDSIRAIDDQQHRQELMSCLKPRLVTDPGLVAECKLRCPDPVPLEWIHPCIEDRNNDPKVYEIWLPQDIFLVGDWQDGNARYNATAHFFPDLDREAQEQMKQLVDELIKLLIDQFQYTEASEFEENGLRNPPRYAQGHLQDKENMLWWASWRSRSDWAGANNRPRGDRFRCGWKPQAPLKEQCLYHVFPRPTNEKDIVHNVATNLTFHLVSSVTVMSNFIGDQERRWTQMASMPPGTPEMWGKDPLARTWMSGQHTCAAVRMQEWQDEGYPDLRTALGGVPQPRREPEARVVCLRNGQDFFPASLTTDEAPGGSPWYSDQLRTAMVGNYLTSSQSEQLRNMHRGDRGRGVLLTFNDRPEGDESLYETLDQYQVTYPTLDGDKPSACVTSHKFPHMLDQEKEFYKRYFPHDKDRYEDTDKNTMAVVGWNKIVTCACRIISRDESIPGCSFIPGDPVRGSPRANGDRLKGHREQGIDMQELPDPVRVALPKLRILTMEEPIPPRNGGGAGRAARAAGRSPHALLGRDTAPQTGCRGCDERAQ